MIRVSLARASIKELKRNIEKAKRRKRHLLDYLHNLHLSYSHGKISYAKYVEILHKKTDGRNIHELIEYYDYYINQCEEEIKKHKRHIHSNTGFGIFILVVLSIFIFSYFNLQPTLTGFFTQVPQEQDFVENVNLEFSETTTYEWQVENQGTLTYIKLDGSIKGQGSVKIYLDDFLVLDSSNIKTESSSSPSITGSSIAVPDLNINDETQNSTNSSSEEINKEKALQNITNETNPYQEEPFPSEIDIESLNVTKNETEIGQIKQFSNYCEETCNLKIYGMNKTSYTLRIEISGSSTSINLESINYGVLKIVEKKPEIVNITEEINVTTEQLPAKLNENVKWKKIIKSKKGKFEVDIPRDFQNLDIKTISGQGSIKEKGRSKKDLTQNVLEIDSITEAEYEISYETPAPVSAEETLPRGKRITISSPDTVHYENVLAFTDLPESLNVKNPSRVKIHWIEQDTFLQPTSVLDKDSNGIYDYVEWLIPSLSNQTFEIIVITKAEHLDSNRNFISDIYDQVKSLDNVWSETINNNEYVRVTFEVPLDNSKDITLFPRITSGNPKIEVYEVNQSVLIAEFSSINSNEYNKVLLTELGQGQCYDSETEIFTDKGWKLFNKLTKEEKVMTLNQKTGEKEWQKPTDYQTFKHNEEMYKIETKKGDLIVSPKHKVYTYIEKENNYFIPNMSSSSRGDSTLTFVCFLSPLSPENIPQLYFNASAKYGASFKFNSSASGSFSMNSEEGAKVICFLINNKTSFNSSCEREVSDNNLSVFSSSSCNRNSGAINSNLFDNLFASNTLKQLPFLINAETTTLTSTTSNIYRLFSFNNSEYLFDNERLISSDSLFACSSVNLDLKTMRFILANSSSSSFNFRDTANCQLIFFINASSFNSSGNFIDISSIEKLDNLNYLNLSDFKLTPITKIYEQINQGKEIYFLNENNEPVKVKSIEKIPYNDKIYGVDVENDIVLVRRGSENATAFWSGNSEGYSQNTFDLKVVSGSVELDHIIDPTFYRTFYNFSNTTHNTAYWGSPAGTRDFVGGTIATALQYGNLSQNDSQTVLVVADAGNDEPFWRFNFTIQETISTINWINVEITSRGNGSGGGETETAYIMNWSVATLHSIGAIQESATVLGVVSQNYTSAISNIVNSTTKALMIYIEGVNYDTNDGIFVDYVSVTVGYSLDTQSPHWYNASTNNTNPLPSANVSHNINWTDDTDLDYATLEINSTGASCNIAANVTNTTISGNVAWSNLTWIPAEACEGKTIGWKQYANDSSNNWNVTTLQTYTVQNVNPTAAFGTNPIDNYNSSSSSVTFDLSCTDNNNVNKTVLYGNWTSAGWHANQTNSTPTSGVVWNVTVAGIADGRYVWGAWCNDSANNQDFADTNRTLTIDTTGPSLSNANANVSSIEQNLQFCLNVTATDSLVGVNIVYAQVVNTTATANYTMTETGGVCSGTSNDGVYGVAINATAQGLWNYTKAFANDSLNNKAELDFTDITIDVTAPSNTAPQVVTVNNDTMTNVLNGPNEGPSLTDVRINVTVYDAEGFTDINMSNTRINFSLSGEPVRSNTSCISSANYSTNYANFTCTVTMYWFDSPGTWTINATASD